ncbi:MAG: hypothetical protein ACK5LP_02950 [Campylobacteraceae bacterium]
MDKPRIYVDFNEMIEEDLVLLSKTDLKKDSDGIEILLFEGKKVDIYMDDEEDGFVDNLIASGTVERNNSERFKVCKWNCHIDKNGIMSESDEALNVFNSSNKDAILKKLLYMTFHFQNYKWLYERCFELAKHKDIEVQKLAIVCIGHIARIHQKVDKQKVLAFFETIKYDENLKAEIENTLEDISIFCKN